jgi:hypothetical protein
MMAQKRHRLLSRRDFLLHTMACAATPFLPTGAFARADYPVRLIPSIGERLPITGLGSTKAVSQLEASGTAGFKTLLRWNVLADCSARSPT